MSNETKRDVFDELLEIAGNAMDQAMLAQYPSDENGCAPGSIGKAIRDILDPIEKRYDAASPCKLPVIPKSVGEYIKHWKDDLLTEPLFVIFLTIQHNINIDNPPDLKAENWIIDHSDTFARTWLLGAWRVEETGEIVKLEEEK